MDKEKILRKIEIERREYEIKDKLDDIQYLLNQLKDEIDDLQYDYDDYVEDMTEEESDNFCSDSETYAKLCAIQSLRDTLEELKL